MSNWGKGVINDIGWGQGANNDIGWGSIYDKSNAGETLLSGGDFEGILNQFPGASLGLRLDKLDKNYTGSAIKVRRSSDNAEQDIGFVDGILDTASLLDFVGSGNGKVVIWYTQIGDGNNATQLTASKQPTIVKHGSVVLDNGKPAILFPTNLQGNMSFNSVNQTTLLSVAKIENLSQINYVLWSESANKGFFYGGTYSGVNGLGIVNGSLKSITGENLESKIAYFNYNGSNYDVAENGNSVTALPNGANFPLDSVGRPNISPVEFDGKMQEIILYPSEQSANKVAMENNINNRYNIY
jgi:hypothetical protein